MPTAHEDLRRLLDDWVGSGKITGDDADRLRAGLTPEPTAIGGIHLADSVLKGNLHPTTILGPGHTVHVYTGSNTPQNGEADYEWTVRLILLAGGRLDPVRHLLDERQHRLKLTVASA